MTETEGKSPQWNTDAKKKKNDGSYNLPLLYPKWNKSSVYSWYKCDMQYISRKLNSYLSLEEADLS